MTEKNFLSSIEAYYSGKFEQYGATAAGVDWNSIEAQKVRFEQLLALCDAREDASVNDYGCGYGALVQYLIDKKYTVHYTGYDISPKMITSARQMFAQVPRCAFVDQEISLPRADYTVASGLFNVKLDAGDAEWTDYILETLETFARLSTKGFSFNCLTRYSDPEYMRPRLYYADPLFLFDHCKRHFSRFVSLIHDYPLYDFTILVRIPASS